MGLNSRRSWKTGLCAWLAVGLWAALIFYFSHQPNLHSNLKWDFWLRKGAHVFEYAVLSLLINRALFLTSPFSSPFCRKISWSLSFLYALSDEWHQSFIPGRNGRMEDVVLDGFGAALGLWLDDFRQRLRIRRKT